MKWFLLVLALFGGSCAWAQIPNSDFEDADSTGVRGWDVVQGNATLFTTADIEDTTVTAVSKDKFLTIVRVGASTGEVATTFPYDKRSATLSGYFIYVHEDFRQRFSIEVAMTKWNGSSTDTVLHQVSRATTDDVEGNPFFDWSKLTVNLEASNYRMNGNPDSCRIVIKSDVGIEKDQGTILFVDKLSFGSSLVADRKEARLPVISVYPNPATDFLFITGVHNSLFKFSIFTLSGQTVLEGEHTSENQGIDLSALQPGCYQIRITTQGTSVSKAFIKSF